MIALNEKPYSIDQDGTGPEDILVAATPVRTGKNTQLSLMITFNGDPGACVFGIQGSLDGINFVPIDDGGALTGTDDTPLGFSVSEWPWLFVDVFQTSKVHDVVATVTVACV